MERFLEIREIAEMLKYEVRMRLDENLLRGRSL